METWSAADVQEGVYRSRRVSESLVSESLGLWVTEFWGFKGVVCHFDQLLYVCLWSVYWPRGLDRKLNQQPEWRQAAIQMPILWCKQCCELIGCRDCWESKMWNKCVKWKADYVEPWSDWSEPWIFCSPSPPETPAGGGSVVATAAWGGGDVSCCVIVWLLCLCAAASHHTAGVCVCWSDKSASAAAAGANTHLT